MTAIICCSPVRQRQSACYRDLMGYNSVTLNKVLCSGEVQLAVTLLVALFALSCRFTLIFKTDPTSRTVWGMCPGSVHGFEKKDVEGSAKFTLCWDSVMD